MFCSVIIKSARLIYEMLYKTVTYVPGTFVTLDPGLYTHQGGGNGLVIFQGALINKPEALVDRPVPSSVSQPQPPLW